MIRIIASIFLCSLFTPLMAYDEIVVPFYSEKVKIAYSEDLLEGGDPLVEEQSLKRYFREMSLTNYHTLLGSLRRASRTLRLNDWLYYQLLQKTLQQIMADASSNQQVLMSWFMLSQSGYDTRLAYLGDQVFLYVYTQDDIYEAPMIKDEGRKYVNLTQIRSGRKARSALYLLGLHPNPDGHSFTFHLRELPLLRPQLSERSLRYFYKGEWHPLEVTVDENIARYMEEYPILGESLYLEAPFSSSLAKSLYPYLRQRIKGKNEWQATELLAAFTRSAFEYKEDKEHFGCSKPMIAEEVFLHPYSDCEDRSALFFNLVRELLDLPMLVVAYPDHLTIAVALPQTKGGSIRYKGRNYYICDPTGPKKSHEIGRVPQGYENTAFKIIESYN